MADTTNIISSNIPNSVPMLKWNARDDTVELSPGFSTAIADAASANFLCALCLYVPKQGDPEAHDNRIVIIGGMGVCVDHAGYMHSSKLSRAIIAAEGKRP